MNCCHSPLLTGRLASACGASERIVARAFAIEREPVVAMPNRGDARSALDPFHRGNTAQLHSRLPFGFPHRRAERVLREEMFEVGQQQFLMLLFVLDAELDQTCAAGGRSGSAVCTAVSTCARQMRMSLSDGRVSRPRCGPRVARSFGLIIAVEQIGVAIVERAVARDMVAQDEGFEKPCGVREVPFGGRGIGHRLRAGVGVGQRRDEVERQATGGGETLREQVRRVGRLRDG